MENKLWFRRKRYGYGWYPNSWEGWMVILVYVVALIKLCIIMNVFQQHSGSDALIKFAIPYIVLTSILIFVCRVKGEKPKWSWPARAGGGNGKVEGE